MEFREFFELVKAGKRTNEELTTIYKQHVRVWTPEQRAEVINWLIEPFPEIGKLSPDIFMPAESDGGPDL
jgi:hypothetical protein